ncbi:MAG: glycosyltransferase family 4 protein [Nitrospirota bacterium]
MKVLYVVNDFFPLYYGGVERYVLNISKQLQRTGHAVKVLTYGMDDKKEGYAQRGGFAYKEYTYENIPVLAVRHDTIPHDIGFRIGDAGMMQPLSDILKEEKPDLVHVAHPMKLNPVITLASELDIPVVLTLTDFWLLCPRGRFFKTDYSPCNSPAEGRKCMRECGIDSSVTRRYQQAALLFEKATKIIAPSRFIIRIFQENGWKREISLVRHCFEYGTVAPQGLSRPGKGETVVFGYTGLVTRFKGVDLLIESFSKVKSDSIRLLIYGDIYREWVWERTFYEDIIKATAADTRIQFMGKYTHNDLPAIFSSMDINIIPSTTLESYGLVVTESLAHNVPVIVSDIVGSAYEYIVDGQNGFVFPVNKPEMLAEIMSRIARDPSLLSALRRNIAPPPGIEEEAFLLENIYRELVR